MGLPKLQFSKDWTNPQDFPAVASDETQARQNIQLLHNETKEYINGQVLPVVDAAVLGFITDEATGKKYRIGFANGRPFYEEVP